MQILIVEDNGGHADELRAAVATWSREKGLGSQEVSVEIRNSGMEALLDTEEGRICPDICIMDIRLGKANGIDIGRRMLLALPTLQIIFISGYDDYYLEVYDVDHVWFLKKPVELDALDKAMSKAMDRLESEKHYFDFESGRNKHYVAYRSILYFENDKRKINIHMTTGAESYYGTMRQLKEQLPDNFVRCHNSYVINLDQVEEFHPEEFFVAGRSIPISRKYRESAKEAFMDRLENRIARVATGD